MYDPILSCKESADLEKSLLRNSAAELDAMSRAGVGIARVILKEFANAFFDAPTILVLAGKGHNGGDALCAAHEILKQKPNAVLKIFLSAPIADLKPNTRHFANLLMRENGAVRFVNAQELSKGATLMLEGLAGMNFAPPMREDLAELIALANSAPCKIKAAVDMPAGLSDSVTTQAFKADVTYMTGIAKFPIFDAANAEYVGRLRYIDLNFFDSYDKPATQFVVTEKAFEPLAKLRAAQSDKRTYGHLFVFAGSANYAGAALMNVKAALRSGVGLVSAFVPESIAPSLAAAEPAAIWIPCPQTDDGGLSLGTFSIYKSKQGRETAILAGSGFGDCAETPALISEIAKVSNVPLILDADAIRSNILDAVRGKEVLLTPHVGEFLRIAKNSSDESLLEICAQKNIACLLKSAISKVCDGGRIAHICAGGPQLSRAGSGDVLAGIVGGLAARKDLNFSTFDCACIAALWAGKAAELAFAAHGENAYATSDVFKYLSTSLNS